jgi:hypothetical protein
MFPLWTVPLVRMMRIAALSILARVQYKGYEEEVGMGIVGDGEAEEI